MQPKILKEHKKKISPKRKGAINHENYTLKEKLKEEKKKDRRKITMDLQFENRAIFYD